MRMKKFILILFLRLEKRTLVAILHFAHNVETDRLSRQQRLKIAMLALFQKTELGVISYFFCKYSCAKSRALRLVSWSFGGKNVRMPSFKALRSNGKTPHAQAQATKTVLPL